MENNGGTGTPMQEDSLKTVSEMPPVLTNTDCTSETLQINGASSLITDTIDRHQTEKAKTETEMDPSDISNVSAARLVRNFIRILSK